MTGSLIREEITLIGVSGGGGFSNTQEFMLCNIKKQ